MSSKRKIIDYYLLYPKESIKQTADALNVSKELVSYTLVNYFRDIHIFKELFFCFSLQSHNLQ